MKKLLILADDALATTEETISWVLFLLIFLTLVAAVFFRYVLQSPFTWTEELVTITFSWVVFLGASACIKAHALLRVDAVIQLLPAPLKSIVSALAVTILLVILASLAYYGFDYAFAVKGDLFPMLHLSMAWAAMALPVSSCFAIVHIVCLVAAEGFGRTLMSVTEMGEFVEQA